MTTITISDSNFNTICLKRCPKRKLTPTNRSNSYPNQELIRNRMFKTIMNIMLNFTEGNITYKPSIH